jgi:hypothetical protein
MYNPQFSLITRVPMLDAFARVIVFGQSSNAIVLDQKLP